MTPRFPGAASAVVAAFVLGVLALDVAAASAQAPPASDKISDGVVKIGLILDMSGTFADVTGQGSATAAQMAVDDFGGRVLGAPVQVVVADHHDSPDRAADIARHWFATEHVDAIMDVAGSSEALIVQAIGGTRDKIVILNSAG
ncbi:MAG TPA: ABC transporter substrate-binding protein, partial [Stellaceae bacterium]|nr:ABC transporter substrate-binding protein [Stellaceae bacterium]